MKVLQFIPSVGENDGGTTTYMQQLTACLGQLCELHVCVLSSSETPVPLEHCQMHSIPKSLFHLSQMKRAWMNLLNEIQPDVVHVNCCWMPQIAFVTQWTNEWRHSSLPNNSSFLIPHSSLPSNSSFLIPHSSLFLTPHGMLEPWIIHRHYWTKKLPAITLYQRHAVQVCDCVIATSEEEKNHLSDLGWCQKIHLVQNGIDVDSVQVKTAWKVPKELLFMSRIHPKKGLEILFDALHELPLPHFLHLTIAGTGEESYLEQLRKKIKLLELQDIVTFVGPVYGVHKWELIRQADAVVLPSYSENYGLIVAEALASGTPVITTTGTPWHTLDENNSGWCVNPDHASIASALVSLQNKSAEEMKILGMNARKLAENDCSIAQKVHELYQLYLSNCVK